MPDPTAAEFWAGQFGDEYTQRNKVNWYARMPFWAEVLSMTEARSVLEVGCNAGWNLIALRALNRMKTAQELRMIGLDLNRSALRKARDDHQLTAFPYDVRDWGQHDYDLVFTAGVLIHIPPEDRIEVMRSIVDHSARYVLCVEYEAPEFQEIEYRGNPAKLWKGPFARVYAEMGLQPRHRWSDPTGFDRCEAWLLEKA